MSGDIFEAAGKLAACLNESKETAKKD